MKRRHFFSSVAKAAVGFSILPAAITYERFWRFPAAPEEIVVVHSYNLVSKTLSVKRMTKTAWMWRHPTFHCADGVALSVACSNQELVEYAISEVHANDLVTPAA